MVIGPVRGDGTHEAGDVREIRRVTFLGICLAAQIWQLCADPEQSSHAQASAHSGGSARRDLRGQVTNRSRCKGNAANAAPEAPAALKESGAAGPGGGGLREANSVAAADSRETAAKPDSRTWRAKTWSAG